MGSSDEIDRHGETIQRSNEVTDEKHETIARTSSSSDWRNRIANIVSSSPLPEEEKNDEGAGQPGNWRSEPGISYSGRAKWKSSIKLPPLGRTGSIIWKMAKFYGPGAIISVAYIDPDNYQSAIASGAEFQYKLLFMMLIANIIAVYLQVLCARLGAVTGMTLAECNRVFLPKWLNIGLWLIAEAAIICTDVGQVGSRLRGFSHR